MFPYSVPIPMLPRTIPVRMLLLPPTVTGMAVEKACTQLKEKLCTIAADILECEPEELRFEGGCALQEGTGKKVSLQEIAVKSQCSNREAPRGYRYALFARFPAAVYGGHGRNRAGS